MKTKLALMLLAPAIVFAAPARQGGGAGSPAVDRPWRASCLLSTLTVASPTTLSADDLVGAVEEERMARDIYVAAAAKWNLPVFTRIAQSEAQHEAVLVRLAASCGSVRCNTREDRSVSARRSSRHLSQFPVPRRRRCHDACPGRCLAH